MTLLSFWIFSFVLLASASDNSDITKNHIFVTFLLRYVKTGSFLVKSLGREEWKQKRNSTSATAFFYLVSQHYSRLFTFFCTKSTTYQYHYHLFFSISLETSIWIMYQIMDMLEACLDCNLSFEYSWLWPVSIYSPFEITLYRSVTSSQHFNFIWQKQTKNEKWRKIEFRTRNLGFYA